MLSPVEQAEAEAATTRALDGAVGTTEEWTSSERTGVSGRSTVTGERVSRGTTCRSVSSVAIADGEEVTIAQNYCRGSDGRWVKQDA
jgi:surface antigen